MKSGARYDNPASCIKRASVKPKELKLPEFDKFNDFIATMEGSGGRFSRACADLVRFLAYRGFRRSEAANVQWQDCDGLALRDGGGQLRHKTRIMAAFHVPRGDAVWFIQHLLQRFDPKSYATFEWPHHCSKPRVDTYDGRPAFITAKEIRTMSTAVWLNEQIAWARLPAGGINQHLLGMRTGSGCKRLSPVPIPYSVHPEKH